ncbi:MAG TPA: transporter [Rikenellaceae bacterium]|nr:transporter [Rikenellaceae bacterium]
MNMPMKRLIMAAVAVAATLPCLAQRTVTLEECYEAAAKNYPLVRQYELIEKSKDYTLSNASKAYLPQVTFSAKASWQSDVTKFNLDRDKLAQSQFGSLITPNELEGMMPTMSKDQYGASIDISQTIWDGGAVKALKDAAASQAEADAKSVDASIYGLRAKINELYFGVILMQSNMDQCDLMLSNLETNYKKVESYIENGVAGQTDLDAIRIQKLKTKQEALNIRNTKSAYLKMLGLLTGIRFEGDTELVKPEPVAVKNEEIQRPELAMYEAQLKALESQNRQITAGLTPKFGLYVSGGYGRPGLNMLDNEFKPYLTAGVRMTWNIGNFYTRKNDMRILETKKSGIEAQRLAFLLNTSIDISGKDSEIKTLREQLEYDDEIIALRKSVLKANEARMAEGTISGSDLVGYMNDERLAEQERTGHEVKMLLAMYNLKYVTNN